MYKVYKLILDGKKNQSVFGWVYILRYNENDAIGFCKDGSLEETTIVGEVFEAEALKGWVYELLDFTDSAEAAKEFILSDIKRNNPHTGETNV